MTKKKAKGKAPPKKKYAKALMAAKEELDAAHKNYDEALQKLANLVGHEGSVVLDNDDEDRPYTRIKIFDNKMAFENNESFWKAVSIGRYTTEIRHLKNKPE